MSKQPVNNGYTRCSECAEVYSTTLKSCPKCGKANPACSVNENSISQNGEFIAENMGLLFNIID